MSKVPPFDYTAVRGDIICLLKKTPDVGPTLVRLAWHQAGTWDATKRDKNANIASMRFEPEAKHGANAGLHVARNALEPIKWRHPNISNADLWSLAGVVAIEVMGGPVVPWRWGRVDAKSGEECPPEGRLPGANFSQEETRALFSRMGFNDIETVALIGAHTVGQCHAEASGYVGPWTPTPLRFGTAFFKLLLRSDWMLNKGVKHVQFMDAKTKKLMMLPADVALTVDDEFKKYVAAFADDKALFFKEFAKAFQKLVELGDHTLNYPAPKSNL